MQFGESLDLAESQAQDFGAETGAAHAEQQSVLELGFLYVGSNFFEQVELGKPLLRDVHPAQPLRFVSAGPDGGVALPEPPDLVVLFPIIQRSFDDSFQFIWEHVELGIEAHARTPAVLPVASSKCLNASAKSFTPSTTSFSVTSLMEMPAFSSEAMTLAASSTFSVKLGRTRPWSRKASKVSGGIVSTVSGPMSSSTYITSRYFGFFVLVLAQSKRCVCAPLAASAFHRGEP